MELPKITCIVGPTASGKTALALELARTRGGEIVNADSRQVYRGMDIATGKLIADDVPHHVFDVVDPDEEYSLASWKVDAEAAIDDILSRGKLPIIVGGTGLYVRALVENLDMPDVKPDPELRARYDFMTAEELFDELQARDPDTAKVIDRKNPRRLIRALEVVLKTGESFTHLAKKGAPKYQVEMMVLNPTPEELTQNVMRRVDEMVDDGLVDEARALFAKYDAGLPSMSGIGYPEAKKYMEGEISLQDMKDWIVKNTLAYAKRQKTFNQKYFAGK